MAAKHLLHSLARTGAVRATDFGCIKMIDCTRNHFGSGILRAKSLFSTRWKIRKLL